MKLEKLLGKIIQMGWDYARNHKDVVNVHLEDNRIVVEDLHGKDYFSLREIVSKESGFWQFVCEKKLIHTCDYICHIQVEDRKQAYVYPNDELYRIMLSSIQEDVEKFLLDNIKINEKIMNRG